jgi:hypothetical protein
MTTFETPFKYANLSIEEYSEKAIVVRGEDTKKLKSIIRDFGKWNRRLRGGPGWILPKKNKDEFAYRINIHTKPELVGTTVNSAHWRHGRYNRDECSGKYICRGWDDDWKEGGHYYEKRCKKLTDNPCGVCPEHHSYFGKEHDKGECIHRTGKWYHYKKNGEYFFSCFKC